MIDWWNAGLLQLGMNWESGVPHCSLLGMSSLDFHGTLPPILMKMLAMYCHSQNKAHHFNWIQFTIFGRKLHPWPTCLITISSMYVWLVKSSCLLSSRAIHQCSFSQGQTGEHLSHSTRSPSSSSSVPSSADKTLFMLLKSIWMSRSSLSSTKISSLTPLSTNLLISLSLIGLGGFSLGFWLRRPHVLH